MIGRNVELRVTGVLKYLLIGILLGTLQSVSAGPLRMTLRSDLYGSVTGSGRDSGGANALLLRYRGGLPVPGRLYAEAELQHLWGFWRTTQSLLDTTDCGHRQELQAPFYYDLRRFEWKLRHNRFDLILGRQIVNWGVGRFFSPVDLYSRIEMSDLDFRRNGSDLIRLRIPQGTFSGFSLITDLPLPGQPVARVAGKLWFPVRNTDVAISGSHQWDEKVTSIGLSLRGDLRIGWWSELAFYRQQNEIGYAGMLGGDYSWHGIIILSLEYLLNETDHLTGVTGSISNQYSQHQSTLVALSVQAGDLLQISTYLLTNLDEPATLSALLVKYNLLQNLDMSFSLRTWPGNYTHPATADRTFSMQGRLLYYF